MNRWLAMVDVVVGDSGWVYISVDGWLHEVLVFCKVVVGKWLLGFVIFSSLSSISHAQIDKDGVPWWFVIAWVLWVGQKK